LNASLTRALFVDDEKIVLNGYRRSLYTMTDSWEFFFATSAAEALEILNHTNVNVLISDIHLQDMPGIHLLEYVRDKYPNVLRIALTGQVEQEAMLRSSNLVHVYLSKPCPVEVLSATLKSIISMQDNLENAKMKALISKMETIPSLPTLYHEILDKLRSPNSSVQEVGRIIAKDIAMTTKILKLVNSAFYGLRQYISDPIRAVIYIGMDTVKNLVLAIHAFSQFEGGQIEQSIIDSIWKHSQAVGSLGKQIALLENSSKQIIDDCFVSGLLHDLGKLILAANLPKEFQASIHLSRDKHISQTEAEKEIIGGTHAAIGGYLLRLWGIPNPIVTAVTYHHNPQEQENTILSPLVFIYSANIIHHQICDQNAEADGAVLDNKYLSKFVPEDRIKEWRKINLVTEEESQS
jgi:HD-like signal output (HDOD) protein